MLKNTESSLRKVLLCVWGFGATALCEYFWKGRSDIAAKLGYVLFPGFFFSFIYFGTKYIFKKRLDLLCTAAHRLKVYLYFSVLTISLFVGLFRGNNLSFMMNEVILFYSLGLFLILAVDEKFCDQVFKLSTIIFWVAFLGGLLTLYSLSYTADFMPEDTIEGGDERFTRSAAYYFYRPFLILGLPLFLYGWISVKSMWKYFQIWSLLGFALFDVFFFKHRGSLVFIGLSLFAVFLTIRFKGQWFKFLGFAFCFLFLVLAWLNSESGEVFISRMNDFNNLSVTENRLPETRRYFDQMGYEWLWGRGLGGGYNLGGLFGSYLQDEDWQTIHIGWLVFTLKGGLPLLIIMLMFFGSWIKKQKFSENLNVFDMTAYYWIPILFLIWSVTPIELSASSVSVLGLSFLMLGRFGKKV